MRRSSLYFLGISLAFLWGSSAVAHEGETYQERLAHEHAAESTSSSSSSATYAQTGSQPYYSSGHQGQAYYGGASPYRSSSYRQGGQYYPEGSNYQPEGSGYGSSYRSNSATTNTSTTTTINNYYETKEKNNGPERFYVSLGGGYAQPKDPQLVPTDCTMGAFFDGVAYAGVFGLPGMCRSDIEFEDTYYYGAGYGFRFWNRFRTDLSVSFYHRFKPDLGFGSWMGGVDWDMDGALSVSLQPDGGFYDPISGDYLDFPTMSYGGDMSSRLALLALHFDLISRKNDRWVIPYLTLGVGSAKNTMDALYVGTNDDLSFRMFGGKESNMAWAAGLGLAFEVSNHFVVDLGYRYTDLGAISSSPMGYIYSFDQVLFNAPLRGDLNFHEAQLNLRFHF